MLVEQTFHQWTRGARGVVSVMDLSQDESAFEEQRVAIGERLRIVCGCALGEVAHPVPVRTLVQQLVDLVGADVEPVFGTLPDRPLEQVRVANVADTYAKLDWRPARSLREGLKRTVDWYRGHCDLI